MTTSRGSAPASLTPVSPALPEPVRYDRLAAAARECLPTGVYDYIVSGAEDEVTTRANEHAWRVLALAPRVLRAVTEIDLTTSVFGRRLGLPVGIAPTGRHALIHPSGEAGTAAGAVQADAVLILSFYSTQALEDVALANGEGSRWLQLPIGLEDSDMDAMVTRGVAAGYEAIVVTVDQPVVGYSPRSALNLPEVPDRLVLPHVRGRPPAYIAFDPQFDSTITLSRSRTFDDLASFVERCPLPVVAKGVLRADDAHACVGAGVAGIIVSNHGGRHLDHAVATATALPSIVAAVAARAEVFVDGGIQRGTDVIKALALGAKYVFAGRLPLWGLAVGGAAGVAATLAALRDELRTEMALVGASSVEELTADLVWHDVARGIVCTATESDRGAGEP